MANDNVSADSRPLHVPVNIWEKPTPVQAEPKLQSNRPAGSLMLWSVLPLLLWFATSNGVAYYFTVHQYWQDVSQSTIALYAMATLYVVPGMLTVVTGFMIWGYALRVHGAWRGTITAFVLFLWQWFIVSLLIYVSIHWHYVYFYIQQDYS